MLNQVFLKTKNVATLKKKGVILHPYLHMMATSLQRQLSLTVPKVIVVGRFDFNPYCNVAA